MHFEIRHRTSYRYTRPVRLGPHCLRFRPRSDGSQSVIDFALQLDPTPSGASEHVDLAGNCVTRVWFEGDTRSLDIDVSMQVETTRTDPYAFILDPAAVDLPDTRAHARGLAGAHLERRAPAAAVDALAAELHHTSRGETLPFLHELNRFLFEEFETSIRDTGAARAPEETLATRKGACRDLAVLFIDCCRAVGLPARFASGYQRGDGRRDRRYLHAWPEAYLLGAGWRGFDPTHGTAVADAHVTVACAPEPADTMPVVGGLTGVDVEASLDFEIAIRASSD